MEPWIPVLNKQGEVREVGVVEVLCNAHEWINVQHSLPIVECGLYRLLMAFVLDIFQPEDEYDWAALWNVGRFDGSVVQKYFEEHHDRFELFSSTHPFLQSPDTEGDDKPLAGLLPSQPSGTNAAHFHHQVESEFAVSPAAATQLLTAIPSFMTAGGAGLSPSINGAPPWYVLLQGNNLFETLLLNTVVLQFTTAQEKGVPIWRNPEPVRKEDKTEAGLLQSLTWQPRRILLRPHWVPDGEGICDLTGCSAPVLVSRMKFSAGWSTRIENWRDPQAAYRITKDAVTILRPRENRALWRDAGALMFSCDQAHGDLQFDRPAVISQYEQFVGDIFTTRDVPLQLVAYGMRTDLKMKVFEWHREELKLPAPIYWKGQFHNRVETAIRLAEEMAYSLGQAIKKTYPRDGAGNNKAFDSLIVRTQNAFWQQLRSPFVDEFLPQVAPLNAESNLDELAQLTSEWHKALQKVARRVLSTAISGLDTNGEAIRRQIEARKYFEMRLWMLLNPDEVQKRKTIKKGDST
ncbi:MAG TPA: type I-E CRISPR-associated protein Cse1/CasA [Abditibacteriaceae bacterium]